MKIEFPYELGVDILEATVEQTDDLSFDISFKDPTEKVLEWVELADMCIKHRMSGNYGKNIKIHEDGKTKILINCYMVEPSKFVSDELKISVKIREILVQ